MADGIGDWVVVTTEYRGVFFGKLKSHDRDRRIVVLEYARNCVYWSAETRGFMGLAANGPAAGSKVTASAPESTLYGVTLVSRVSDEARKRWEGAPWSS